MHYPKHSIILPFLFILVLVLFDQHLFATSMDFTIVSPVTQTSSPFTLGYTFCQGDIPAGMGIRSTLAAFQADVKNRWPDGSAKFTLLSGEASLAANTPLRIPLSAGVVNPTNQTVLTEMDLLNTGVTASINFEGYGVVELRPLIGVAAQFNSTTKRYAAGRMRQWISGPQMSSWIYYSPIGEDLHLTAWFEVRLYKGGNIEIQPWIENGYLKVTTPGEKSGRAIFSLGGVIRYDSKEDANLAGDYNLNPVIDAEGIITMPHHTRMVLIRNGTFSHWLLENPQITSFQSTEYLQTTHVVPTYHPAIITPSSLSGLTKNYCPMAITYLAAGMGGVGYHPSIGVLPNESALFLVSGDVRAYKAVLSSGFSLGCYCIHYRDEKTNKPILFAQYPNEFTQNNQGLPTPSGRNSCVYASSHHPSAAYLPYLLTGWFYFTEELQFQVTLHYLSRNAAYRDKEHYYFCGAAWLWAGNENSGERAQAWQWRSTAMAASITPDTDSLMRSQFIKVLSYNATESRKEFETGTTRNPAANTLGLAGWGHKDSGQFGTWQDDFMTAAIGLTWDLAVVNDSAKKEDLLWFRNHKYKSVVGRLGRSGVASEWPFTNAVAYDGIKVGINPGNTFTFYATWGECYAATFGANANPSNILVGGEIESGSDGLATGYWGNLLPAIAYAVSHRAPGALDGYNRLIRATNFTEKESQFNTIPVWGIKPYSYEQSATEKVQLQIPPLFKMYPNPITRCQLLNLELQGMERLSLYSINGQKMASLTGNVWQANLAPGLYLVLDENRTKKVSQKLVVVE